MQRASVSILCLMATLVVGCNARTVSMPVDSGNDSTILTPDSSPDGTNLCAEADEAFADFIGPNRWCGIDTDCVIVGDCGPNADFTAVRVGAAAEARRLMGLRCSGIWDGPRYDAVCEAGRCTAVPDGSFCGAPAPDAGDAGAPDGSWPDGSWPDGSWPDGSWPDGSWPDASWPDASWPDAGWPDAGWPDASWPDASWPDAGWPDAGWPDASWPDAGWPDAGDASWPDAGDASADAV